jgi:LDH2 family malate/lactate/ureidoglycolate dehydrogenase
MAVDITAFTELDAFKKTTGDILRDLRASKKAPGHDRIYTAGEKEYLAYQERKGKGVPMNETLIQEILAMQKELGLTQYKFDF